MVAGIGNALMAEPMVRQAARSARVRVLAWSEAMCEVFRRVPGIGKVEKKPRGLTGVLRVLRKPRADVCVVPFPSNRWQYSVLARLTGAPRLVMHGYPAGRWVSLRFLVRNRLEATRGLHDVQQNLLLLKELGIEPDLDDRPRFPLREEERESARKVVSELKLPDRSFVVMHAGSAQTVLAKAKRWGPANYGALVRKVRSETGLGVLIVEGPDEAGVAREILDQSGLTDPGVCALSLKGSLGEAGAILERASVYAGSDSGLAHLAAAVGTPAVTIFAPADPVRVCPYGYHDLVVRPDLPCSPCFQYPWESARPKMRCREPMCIGRVTVDQVWHGIERALRRQRVAAG